MRCTSNVAGAPPLSLGAPSEISVEEEVRPAMDWQHVTWDSMECGGVLELSHANRHRTVDDGVRRLLYWVNQFAVGPDQPGGTRHYDMSRKLLTHGMAVTLVASDFNLTLRKYLRRRNPTDRRHLHDVRDGVNFVWLPAGNYQFNNWRRALSMVVFALHTLVFLLRAPMTSDTVIIGSSPHLIAAAAARLAALVRRTPFVLEVRDLWPESLAVSGSTKGFLYRMLCLLADVLYRSSSQVVVLAQGNAAHIAQRGVPLERIHYIPNGVDTAQFKSAIPEPLHEMTPHRHTFIYAGAHGPANGLDVLLCAAQHLMRWGENDIHIFLLGDGPAKNGLIQSTLENDLQNVTFLDPIPKQQIPGALKACTAGLMVLADLELFRFGVSPNKLFDYLCAELPVITNVPGDVARMVREAEAGLVVPPSDPEALAQAMIAIARNTPTARSGLAWVERHHDRSHLAAKLRDVVECAQG